MSNWKKWLIAIGILTVLLLWVCNALFWSKLFIPAPPPYVQGQGYKYAMSLADTAQRLSLVLLVLGWVLVSASAIMAMAAALLGAAEKKVGDTDGMWNIMKRQRGLLCAALAIVFGGFGWQLLDRSGAASQMASIATIATGTADISPADDRSAYDACIKAKASWLEGRMNFDRLQSIVKSLEAPKQTNGVQKSGTASSEELNDQQK